MKLNIATPSSPAAGAGTMAVLSSSADWLSSLDNSAQTEPKAGRDRKSTPKQTPSHWYDDPNALRGL
jgi:hypothetical protein